MDFFELIGYANIFLIGVENPFTALWSSLIIAGVLFAALYALQAVALYTIAKREGFAHKWMAFVPFFNSYYIGVVSEKNRFYRLRARSLSLVLAIVEFVLVASFVLSCVSQFLVFYNGLYTEITSQVTIMGTTQTYVIGYESSPAIVGTWLGWVFDNLGTVLSYLNYVYIILNVLVVISFFQTYACRAYFWRALICALLPIRGLLMFTVRNNRGMNYREYIRGEQRRRYQMYQQYNTQNGAPGGYNPYNGRPTPPADDGTGQAPPSDPFEGLGSSQGGASEDPFDEFKN